MGSILIITNNYEIDPELLELLEKEYRIHIASDTWDGLNIIDEHHIDTFAIMSNDYIEKSIMDLLIELAASRSIATPVIFISENPRETLQSKVNKSGSWYLIEYPLNHGDFMTMIRNTMIIANALNDRSITIRKKRIPYTYKVRNISRIKRTKDRYIKIYSRNPITLIEEEEEFFYEFPLPEFLKEYGIEKEIKQAQQSWLVNASEIKEVRKADMELVLANGIVIPTSKKYINNFL